MFSFINPHTKLSINEAVISQKDLTASTIEYLHQKGYSYNNFKRIIMHYIILNKSTDEVLFVFDSKPTIKNGFILDKGQPYKVDANSIKILASNNYKLPAVGQNYNEYLELLKDEQYKKMIDVSNQPKMIDVRKVNYNIQQIYFKNEQKKSLQKLFIQYYNEHATKYLETEVILDVRRNHLNQDATHTGVVSYQFFKKTNKTDIQTYQIIHDNPDYDAFGFQMRGVHPSPHAPFRVGNNAHPEMIKIANLIGDKMGIKDMSNQVYNNAYCNFYIYKKDVFVDYVDNFLTPIKQIMDDETNEELYDLLHKNSMYHKWKTTDKRVLQQIFNKDYYTYHAFVCERLPGLFLKLNNYKQKLILAN